MIVRVSAAFGIAILVVSTLFHLMWSHISTSSQGNLVANNEDFIEFVRIKPNSQLQTRKRKLPDKPKEIKKAPTKPKLNLADDMKAPQPDMNMDIPKMDLAFNSGNGPYMGAGGGGAASGEVLPLVRIEPQYPRKAAMSGTQGWVLLKFDITPTGAVEGVKVLEAKPRRVFNSAAKRALLKWKYRPKVIDGKPVSQTGNKVKIEFKLEG